MENERTGKTWQTPPGNDGLPQEEHAGDWYGDHGASKCLAWEMIR